MSQERELDDEPGSVEATPRGDLSYRGIIVRLARGTQSGAVRSASGREIPFELQYVTVLGQLAAALGQGDILQVGTEVGYDVGWTSRGLRVTKLFAAASPVSAALRSSP